MAATSVTVLCLLLALCCYCSHGETADGLDRALDRLTSRVVQLTKKLDSKIAGIGQAEEAGHDGGTLLDMAFGNGCPLSNMFRCGGTVQCVSLLLVCDGSNDCTNGEDEQRCETPLKVGDVYVGGCGVMTCTNKYLTDRTYEDVWPLTGIEKVAWFPQTQRMTWDYFPSPDGTIGFESGYTSMKTYHRIGVGRFQTYYDNEGSTMLDKCVSFEGGRVLKCYGYRPSLFEIGDPCYTCHYRLRG